MKKLMVSCLIFSFIFTTLSPNGMPAYALTRTVRQAGLADELMDFGYANKTKGLIIKKDKKGIDGTSGNVAVPSELPASMVYQMGHEIKFFNIYMQSHQKAQQQNLIKVFVSYDGESYSEVMLDDPDESAIEDRYLYTYKTNKISQGQKYLKIEFLTKDAALLKVEINYSGEEIMNAKNKNSGSVFVDELDDFSRMLSYTEGIQIDTSKPEETAGDISKAVVGNAPEGASIVYQLESDIAAFRITKYVVGSARTSGQDGILKFYLSPDNKNYSEITVPENTLATKGLVHMAHEALTVPAGNRFLKIVFTNKKVNWTPKIGKVEIYYGKQSGKVASVLNQTTAGETGSTSKKVVSTGVPVPSGEEIISKLKEKSPNDMHPRLSATKEDFERIKSLAETDPNVKKWFVKVKGNADAYLTKDPMKYELPDGRRLLEICREVLKRTKTLAMTYRMTGDSKYAERLWKELDAAGSFKDWNPSHFLDVAEMTNAFALGYDWIYDYWTDEQKQFIKNAIVNKGLKEAEPFYKSNNFYTTSTNNWNTVCNSGIGMGALAIAQDEDVSKMAGDMLSGIIKSLPLSIAEMSPSGVYPEGPSYWDYANRYLTYFLSAMDTAVGNDYGLSTIPGFDQTGNYPLYTAGGAGAFNFSDSGEGFVTGPELYWMAQKFNKPEYSWYERNAFPDGDVDDMLWYNPNFYKTPAELNFPLDKVLNGHESIASFRDSWEDKLGLFAAIKGGDNQSGHGDLDIGTFIMDWQGIRWAKELGMETYDIPGYWDMDEKAGRWTYYRKRAEGHNTLVINPGKYPDQNVFALCGIPQFQSNPFGGYAVVDMTEAYRKDAVSAKRGLMLFENRSRVMVQDEISSIKSSDIYWFMHTPADVQIDKDGKSAMLTLRGKKMKASLVSPANARFTLREAKPFPETFSPKENLSNSGINKLTVELKKTKKAQIAVVFTPILSQNDENKELPAFTTMDKWSIKELKVTKLNEITVNGQPLKDFDPNKFSYSIAVPKGFTGKQSVEAKGENVNITISQSSQKTGTAVIKAVSDDPDIKASTYTVNFVREPVLGIPAGLEEFKITGVKASAVPQKENNEQNAVDGKLDTRWSADGKQYLEFDLGQVKNVGGAAIAFFNGSKRKTFFDISVSENGKQWNKVFDGESSGMVEDFETFDFEVTKARYIRINGNGNTENTWNSIGEVKVFGEIK